MTGMSWIFFFGAKQWVYSSFVLLMNSHLHVLAIRDLHIAIPKIAKNRNGTKKTPQLTFSKPSPHRRHLRPPPYPPHALHPRSPPRLWLDSLFRPRHHPPRPPLRPAPRRPIHRHRSDGWLRPDARDRRPGAPRSCDGLHEHGDKHRLAGGPRAGWGAV